MPNFPVCAQAFWYCFLLLHKHLNQGWNKSAQLSTDHTILNAEYNLADLKQTKKKSRQHIASRLYYHSLE